MYLLSVLIFISIQVLIKIITTTHFENVDFFLYFQGFSCTHTLNTHGHTERGNFLLFLGLSSENHENVIWRWYLLAPQTPLDTRKVQAFWSPFSQAASVKRTAPSQRYWRKVSFNQWHELRTCIWEKNCCTPPIKCSKYC